MNFTKGIIIALLAAVNSAVVILGLWYTTASITAQNKVLVFGIKVPAFLLGFAVIYIGVRSYLKLFRLYEKLRDPMRKFSWQNFKGGILR